MVDATFKVRAVGPGLDFAEWGEAKDLDDMLEHLTLAIRKFKRDAARAETAAEIGNGSLAAMPRNFWEAG